MHESYINMLADDSHVISYLIFVKKLGKLSQDLLSAAVVIGALMVKNKTESYNIQFLKLVVCQVPRFTKKNPTRGKTKDQ